ncbi:CAP domain-containing protein [Paraphoma chrysanthemicola]|nr:CAP domain-containing protein [Paraphoma chrysanthemicola]
MKIFAPLIALAAATAVAAPTHEVKLRALKSDDAPHQDDSAFISAVMRAHWYWRKLHCAQDLVWDPELANAARADIEKCPHDAEHERPGSNLSSVSPAPATFEDWIELARTCVHGWHEEEVLYPYDNPHFSAAWGHFSQMVWRNSTRIGCAVGHCEDEGDHKVNYPARIYCYYEFFGNNIAAGQFEQQVWAPVCHDPSAEAVAERANIDFDWTARK